MQRPTSKNAIKFSKICFGYEPNKVFLQDVSFEIKENEYVCIVGHNGSGKSTVSKILNGLLKPWSGQFTLFGELITKDNIDYLRNNIGVIFQNPDNQFIGLSVEDDIAFGLENKQVEPTEMWPIIKNVTKIVGISHLLDFDSQLLSGGQKQHVAIASVLALDPKIIVFDEATSMLDPKSTIELKQLMLELKNKFKKTVISITHDMDEIIKADKVLVMNSGKLVASGKPQDVFVKQQDVIKKSALNAPFVLELSQLLNERNKNIKPTMNLDVLIKQVSHECK